MDVSSEIEKKKIQSQVVINSIDWSAMGKSVLTFSFQMVIMFLIGSRVVFACKVAQANYLPTDLECMPYTPSKDEESPEFDDKEPRANIDITYLYDKNTNSYTTYSTKIAFQINKNNQSNYFINMIRETEYNYKVDPMIKFICVVIKKLFAFNFSGVSGLLNFMNGTLNESTIIIVSVVLLRYYLTIIYFISVIVSIILCITNCGWLFKTNKNNVKGYKHITIDKPVWRSSDPFSSFTNFFGTILYMWVGFWVAIGLSLSPIPAIIAVICVITPMIAKAKIIDPDNPTKDLKDCETYTFMSSIRGLLETKIDLFMLFFCLNMIYTTFIQVTPTAAIFVLIASIFFLWMTVSSKKIPDLATEGLLSYDKNGKTCPHIKMTQVEMDKMLHDEEEDIDDEKRQKQDAWNNSLVGSIVGAGKSLIEFGEDDTCPNDVSESNVASTEFQSSQLTSTPKELSTETKAEHKGGGSIRDKESSNILYLANPNSVRRTSLSDVGSSQSYLLHKIKKLTDTLKKRR